MPQLAPLLLALQLAAAAPAGGLVESRVALADDARSFGADATAVLTWPARLDPLRLSLLAGAGVGTAALLHYDVPAYAALHRDVRWTWRGRSVFNETLLLGDGLVDLGVVSAFAVGDSRAQQVTVQGMEALAAVALTSTVGKHIFRVERPQGDPLHKHYFDRFSDDAFPSGHTMSAFATATVVSGQYPSVAPIAYGAATLVGLSVIERGWHWPSDVLAGAALGTSIGWVTRAVNQSRISIGPGPGLGLAAASRF